MMIRGLRSARAASCDRVFPKIIEEKRRTDRRHSFFL